LWEELLRDGAPASAFVGSKELEHHMAVLGRLSHPSMVPLKAYYYAHDVKLLVYEFMPKGSSSFPSSTAILSSLCSEPPKNLASRRLFHRAPAVFVRAKLNVELYVCPRVQVTEVRAHA
jgi:hypothetical protein